MYIGEKIKKLCKRERITQKELAAGTQTPESSVSIWINSAYPPTDWLEKVAAYFDMQLWELFYPENTALPDLNTIDAKYLSLFQQAPEELQVIMIDTSAKIVEAYNLGKK